MVISCFNLEFSTCVWDWGFVFTTVFNPEQHVPSGFCAAPPTVTNGRQSTMFTTRLLQSRADCAAEERDSSTAIAKKVTAIFTKSEFANS